MAKDGNTAENRFQIDIFALRQSYTNGEIERIGWIPGVTNPADALTKTGNCTSTVLSKLIATNRFSLTPIGCASIGKNETQRTTGEPNDKQGGKEDHNAHTSVEDKDVSEKNNGKVEALAGMKRRESEVGKTLPTTSEENIPALSNIRRD